MRRLLKPEEFAAALDARAGDAAFARTTFESADISGGGRTVSYKFSDDSVARDAHRIFADAWDLSTFETNPVFLWMHFNTEPPIGRVTDIGTIGNTLRGTVEYADADTYPFADTIYRLVKGKFLNACSVSWDAVEWKFSLDKDRALQRGIDFLKVKLIEISQAPVPILSSALAQARAAGVDTQPAFEWAGRLLDSVGMAPINRAELETLRSQAKMANRVRTRATPAPKKRSLWDISDMASVLGSLGWITDNAKWEAEYEGDNSTLPAKLTQLLKDAGSILVAMTIEEVSEFLALKVPEEDGELIVDEAMEWAGNSKTRRALVDLVIFSRGVGVKPPTFKRAGVPSGTIAPAPVVAPAVEQAPAQEQLDALVRAAVEKALKRAGRVLSADNEKLLKDAIANLQEIADQLDEDDETGETETTRAARAREVRLAEVEVARAAGKTAPTT